MRTQSFMLQRTGLLCGILFFFGSFFFIGCKDTGEVVVSRTIEEEATEEVSEEWTEEVSEEESLIYVHVSGAVVNHGVYSLPEGSRIYEAIALAGGMTEEGDFDALNQAQVLTDGQMVYVYSYGEEKTETLQAEESDGLINLNTATKEELMTLSGIGESKAESIISYRESNGGFSSIEEIMNIEGIKEGIYSKIKDKIKV